MITFAPTKTTIMRIKNLFIVPVLMLALTGVVACGSSKKSDDTEATEKKVVIKAPAFDADSAYVSLIVNVPLLVKRPKLTVELSVPVIVLPLRSRVTV